jgi:hypothetical protein
VGLRGMGRTAVSALPFLRYAKRAFRTGHRRQAASPIGNTGLTAQ